jgi:hypothetical protein
MRLSKASYFADFAVYPPAVLALLILALRLAPFLVWIEWSIACLGGVAAWTFVEYVMHRGVLHGIRFFAVCMTCITRIHKGSWAHQLG